MFCNVGVHRLAVARGCLPGLQPMAVTAAVAHLPEHPVEACISALVRYEDDGAMLYEEIGYFPAPEWMNTGTHFAFEQGIVAWDENTWRIVTRDGKEVEHALPDQESGYATVYRNMLRAMQGQPYAPQTWEFAVDAMIAQAAYASARTGETIDLKSDPWRISATGEDQ